jgi:hypothetical protein
MAQAKDATTKSGGTALSGPELEDALARGSLEPKPQLIGMVKASSMSGYVSFAQAGCESWVDVPTSLIAEAHQIGHQPCDDHSHPLFRLVLSEPTDPEAKALIGLLTARSPAPFMPMPTPANLGAVAAAGSHGASASELRKSQCTSGVPVPRSCVRARSMYPGSAWGT